MARSRTKETFPELPEQGDAEAITWLESEDAWYSPKRELVRLKRRAQARWLVILMITAVLIAAVLKKASAPATSYTARVIIRVTETDLLSDRTPLVGRGLADYLLDATLRTDGLLALLERNGLYDSKTDDDPTTAVTEFRDELRVAVYRNYFNIDRGSAEGARTARISIRYSDDDPERAVIVVREVANLMAATEAENRRVASIKLGEIGRLAANAAEDRMEDLQQRRSAAQRAFGALDKTKPLGTVGATLRVEIRGLDAAIERQTGRIAKARKQLASMQLREAVVNNRLGVDFRVVDERPPEVSRGLKPAFLGMLAITLFVLLAPLVAVGVGAFDNRVHDGDDVGRLGLNLLGQIGRKHEFARGKQPAILKKRG